VALAARVVLGLKLREHIDCCALRELHWLPISERVVYKLFSRPLASLGQSPDYITDLLQPVAATSSRSSLLDASRGYYCSPTDKPENSGYRALSTAAPRPWNQLPTEPKRIQSTCFLPRTEKFSFQPCILLQGLKMSFSCPARRVRLAAARVQTAEWTR